MDRRQRKTREAIFSAFTELLSKKDFGQITVGEVITRADVGRATFYAHFETKEHLLQALCEELFCHIFDSENGIVHKHIFDCEAPDSVFLHLFRHLQKNDNNILTLLAGQNNNLFLRYFEEGLQKLIQSQLDLFAVRKNAILPNELWQKHIASTFVETVRWWADTGMRVPPETVTEYFFQLV